MITGRNIQRVLGTVLLLIGLSVVRVSAQEAADSASSASEVPVVQRESLQKEIDTLKKTYRGQLSEYLQAEREFSIAREQYKQLETLASIEKVIEEGKTVMSSRAQVLETYFHLLELSLLEAEGIEISLKGQTLDRIKATREFLTAQKAAVEAAEDRVELNSLSDDFFEAAPNLQLLAQQTTTLLSIGKLQNVADQITTIEGEIFSEASSSGSFARQQRETKRVMDSTAILLDELWAEAEKGVKEFKVLAISQHVVKSLDPVYAGLNKALGFLFEVVGL